MKTPTKSKYDKEANDLAEKIINEQDRVKRWKLVHELLRKQNKKARREQDKTAKEAAEVREEGIYKKSKTKVMGLRFGVALPPTTYAALVQSDVLIHGHSDLQHPDKEASLDLTATNKIVKDLEKAFPQYKVS